MTQPMLMMNMNIVFCVLVQKMSPLSKYKLGKIFCCEQGGFSLSPTVKHGGGLTML